MHQNLKKSLLSHTVLKLLKKTSFLKPEYTVNFGIYQRNLSTLQKNSLVSESGGFSLSSVNDKDVQSSNSIPRSKKFPLIQYPKEADTEIEALPSEKAKTKILELTQNIQMCENISSLINFYWDNKNEFGKPQYLIMIEKFSEFQNGSASDPDLLKIKEFQSICYHVWKLCSTLEAAEVLQLYKNFLEIGVPSHFLLMQSLLQMMRHQINLFDTKDLLFMKRLLVKTSPCKLQRALETAIPRILENHVKFYVTPKLQVHELLQMLDVCIKGKVEGAEKIIFLIYHKKLQDLYHPRTPYYYNNLLSLIWSILDIFLMENKYEILKPSKDIEIVLNVLVNNTFDELIKNNGIKSLKVEQVIALTKKLQTVYSKRYDIPASVKYLDSVSHIARYWKIDLMSSIIACQVAMHYVNEKLLNSLTDILFSSDAVDFSDVKVFPLLSAVAATDTVKQRYNPEVIYNLLNKPQNPQPQTNIDVPWIKLVLNIMSMNCLPEELLKIIFDEHNLQRYLEFRSYSKVEYLDLLRVHRAMKMFWPKSCTVIPEKYLQTAITIQKNNLTTPFLTPTLKSIFGENCIASSVITDNLSMIDHQIFLDEHKNPMPLSLNDVVPVELSAVVTANGCLPKYRICLMEVPESWTCRPNSMLRGHFKIELDTIHKELNDYYSCSTIMLPIFEKEINDMDTVEVPLYLKEKIYESVS